MGINGALASANAHLDAELRSVSCRAAHKLATSRLAYDAALGSVGGPGVGAGTTELDELLDELSDEAATDVGIPSAISAAASSASNW